MPENNINVDLNLKNNKVVDPRLNPRTTAQRLAMNASLTANDEGLTVWDSDLNAFFIWDAPTLDWVPSKAKLYLPTPRVYIPNQGFQNQMSGQDPNNIFAAISPTQANKPVILKLYFS